MSKIIQSQGITAELLRAIPQVMFHSGAKEFQKATPELAKMATKHYVNKGANKLKTVFRQVKVPK